MKISKLISVVLVLAVAGVAVDFLFNGVLKILWIIVYGPVYLGLAGALYNRALEGRWRPFAGAAALAFLAGAAAGHVFMTGRMQTRVYPMTLVSASPVSLESPQFSERLFVASDKLQREIAQNPMKKDIPISVQVTQNYGCIEAFKIASVMGVDVMSDPQAAWVWKSKAGVPSDGGQAGIDAENHRRPWCLIHWF